MRDGGDQAEPASEASIKILLKRAGWKEARAFFEPADYQAEASDSDTKPRTDSERKAAQRKRQLDEGLRQINVMAPDEEDVRALIVQVAIACKSKPMRRAVAAVLTDRDLVSIGRKVRRLRGDAADQVRALLKL